VGLKNPKGFTLIEAILVIVIIGILAVIIGVPLIQGSLAWQAVSTRKAATQQARLGMDRMVRELRNVQATAANTPNFNQFTAAPDCVAFTNLSGTMIAFRLNVATNSIERATGAGITCATGGTSLVSNVTNFTITCYNGSNALVSPCSSSPSTIRRLLLHATVQVGTEPVSLDSQVTLRSELGL
jgi:prepilin-type N-terminal cleavage/methylation domain-containing protein